MTGKMTARKEPCVQRLDGDISHHQIAILMADDAGDGPYALSNLAILRFVAPGPPAASTECPT